MHLRGRQSESIEWPVWGRPEIAYAGLAPLASRAFDYTYLSPTHALHLHDYRGTLRLGPREIRLSPGTMTLTPAGVPSSYDLPTPGTHACIHFSATAHVRESEAVLRLPIVREVSEDYSAMFSRFETVSRWYRSRMPNARAAATLSLQELLICFAEGSDAISASDLASQGIRALERVAAYVDRHLASPLSSEKLAEIAGLSQNYLARLFRRRYDMTLPRFVAFRRINLARRLLRITDLPIKQVGLRVGYPDPQHFNKTFRALTGSSPSDYRAGKFD